MSESTSNDPTSVVLSLDNNHAAPVDVRGSRRVDVESDDLTYESENRKRARFE